MSDNFGSLLFRAPAGGGGGGADIPETTELLKGDGSGGVLAAEAGTDYQAPIDASHKLPIANVSGYTLKTMEVTYDDDTTETFQVVTADVN